mmetsp:Transcript_381/g.898  ORF Transcript_381/g.898 Transcript_381/m.898 type:complete len:231 (+) Transcript_381:283-975(+)
MTDAGTAAGLCSRRRRATAACCRWGGDTRQVADAVCENAGAAWAHLPGRDVEATPPGGALRAGGPGIRPNGGLQASRVIARARIESRLARGGVAIHPLGTDQQSALAVALAPRRAGHHPRECRRGDSHGPSAPAAANARVEAPPVVVRGPGLRLPARTTLEPRTRAGLHEDRQDGPARLQPAHRLLVRRDCLADRRVLRTVRRLRADAPLVVHTGDKVQKTASRRHTRVV